MPQMALVDIERTVADGLKSRQDTPAPVDRWIVKSGEDSTDRLAVWVWAVVHYSTLTSDDIAALRRWTFDEVSKMVPDVEWVYVRFRDVTEVV